MAGKGKVAVSALEAVVKAMAEAQPKLIRASEALAPHEGKILKPLQYDRMRVNLETNDLGGPEYSGLSLYNPAHEQSGVVAAVSNKGALSRVINQYKDLKQGTVIHTPQLGSEIQHRGNPTMFSRFHNELMEKIKSGEVDQEQIDVINNRLNSTEIGPKGNKRLLFPQPVDIASPEFRLKPYTFEQRSEFADVVGGAGIVKTLGKERGKMIDITSKLGETIDPYIADAPTGAFGHRLVELGTNTLFDPTLHGDYPYHIIGKDMGVRFKPIEKKYMTDFIKQIMEDKTKARFPSDMDFRTGNVSQEITPEWLQYLKDIGNKDGGSIHPDGSARLTNGASARKTVQYILKDQKGYGAGGVVKNIAKKLAKELPEASASGKTPISTTVGTYKKASPILLEDIKDVNAPILDYGSGMGLGAEELRKTFPNVKTLEPFYKGNFDFTDPSKVPSGEFKGLTNFSVLNAVTPEVRDSIVENIGRVMDRGGVGLITARSPSAVMSTKGMLANEPNAMITQKGTYQKGFDTDELREYIKYILGSDFEYEPLKGLSGTSVKVKKKADGGSVEDDTRYITQDPTQYLLNKVKPVSTRLDAQDFKKRIGSGNLFGRITGDIVGGVKDIAEDTAQEIRRLKPQSAIDVPVNAAAEAVGFPMDIAEELNDRVSPIRSDIIAPKNKYLMPIKPLPLTSESLKQGAKDLGITSGEQFPNLQFASQFALPSLGRLGVKGAKAYGNLVKEGIERNIERFEPRMGIIKDPGGMVVGGEKALDDELISIKRTENNFPHAHQYFVPEGEREALKDPNAVALNAWIDTKVKKYIRNQAGSKDDPILKAIESGVEHNFTPPQSGDTKYTIAMKRKFAGKDPQGIATTERGKDWEYTVDSIFNPVKSSEIKDILQRNKDLPPSEASDKFLASVLRTEHDLPVYTKKDLDALQLINQIPDETVYGLNPAITNKLGLDHMTDVLSEDLNAGRLRPEQLNQMSMEKAIRRVAEYDAEKARIAAITEADRIKDLPMPITYNKDYKWLELKHPTDAKITKEALESEGNQMGHCVGTHCEYYDGVMNGSKQVFSLRDANNKPHVTIETNIIRDLDRWLNANKETIANDPKLSKMIFTDDFDEKYPRSRIDDEDLVNEYIGNMKKIMKEKGLPINEDPSAYVNIKQVKGGKNSRPKEEYQDYISDFIQKNPTGHEIADIKELGNTNLMSVDDVGGHGLVPKDIHFHPDVEKIVKNYPTEKLMQMYRGANMQPSQTEFNLAVKENIFREAAKDLARQGKNYFTKDELINHLKDKYLTPPKKAEGGSIDLQQEYKLENMRRRYG